MYSLCEGEVCHVGGQVVNRHETLSAGACGRDSRRVLSAHAVEIQLTKVAYNEPQ